MRTRVREARVSLRSCGRGCAAAPPTASAPPRCRRRQTLSSGRGGRRTEAAAHDGANLALRPHKE
eukprot:492468-Pleurochrysis_carterae.AAC.2